MFYVYNRRTLQFEKAKWVSNGLKILGGAILISMMLGISYKPNVKNNYTESEVMLINSKFNTFDNDKLIQKIKNLNFKFPDIVYAQSILESGHFKKAIFTENHNLFSMKEAYIRINLAKGTQNGHAYYDNWVESVYDYALYSATYLSTLKTEEEYFNYLGQNYAEDSNYVNKLKQLIAENNIKHLFK